MKCKKLLSLAMAGVMSLSLAVPAFASGATDVTGTYAQPTIAVDVTPTAAAFINPLGLDVEIDSTNHVSVSGQQIVSAPMTIKNKSAMDLKADVEVTTTVATGSSMRFTSATTGGTGASKTVFAYLQAKQSDLVGTEDANGGVEASDISEAFAAWEASDYNEATDVVLNSALSAKKSDLVILRAADMTGTNGAFAAYKKGSVALVRLTGDCVAVPTTGAWTTTVVDNTSHEITSGDGFKVNIAYTFSPASITKFAVNIGAATGGSASSAPATVTADMAKAAVGDVVTVTVTGSANSMATLGATYTAEGAASATALDLTYDTTNPLNAANGTNPKNVDFTFATGASGDALVRTFTFVMPEGAVNITVNIP